jgi:hypothetical protein
VSVAFLSKKPAVHLSPFFSVTLLEMYVYVFLFARVVMDNKSRLRVARYRMFTGQNNTDDVQFYSCVTA